MGRAYAGLFDASGTDARAVEEHSRWLLYCAGLRWVELNLFCLAIVRQGKRMETRTSAPRSLVVAAFLSISIIWGSTYLGIRVALEEFPPFQIGAIRFLVAGTMLCLFARLRGQAWPTLSQWAGSALVGGLFFVIGNGFLNVAELSVSSGLAAVLVATMPLWATVFARLFGEHVTRREWVGIALGLAGVAVMNFGGDLRASGRGAAFALMAPMGWGLGSVLIKRLRLPPGPMIVGVEMLTGGFAVLLISMLLGEKWPSSPSWRAISAVAYLAIMGSLVGFTAYAFLLRHTRAAVATSYAYINPVVAILLGMSLGGEHIDAASATGGVIVLTAVLLVSRGKAKVPARQSPSVALPEPAADPNELRVATR
jgi:drug/metabolite transporter (DMT)-like permease